MSDPAQGSEAHSEAQLRRDIDQVSAELSALPLSRGNMERRLRLNQRKQELEAALLSLGASRRRDAILTELDQLSRDVASLPEDASGRLRRTELQRRMRELRVELDALR